MMIDTSMLFLIQRLPQFAVVFTTQLVLETCLPIWYMKTNNKSCHITIHCSLFSLNDLINMHLHVDDSLHSSSFGSYSIGMLKDLFSFILLSIFLFLKSIFELIFEFASKHTRAKMNVKTEQEWAKMNGLLGVRELSLSLLLTHIVFKKISREDKIAMGGEESSAVAESYMTNSTRPWKCTRRRWRFDGRHTTTGGRII